MSLWTTVLVMENISGEETGNLDNNALKIILVKASYGDERKAALQ